MVLGKVYKNCTKSKEKRFFYENYFEESNITKKPLIWSQDKKIMKFGQKKMASLVLGKVYENNTKIKEKCYFMKLTSKRIILIRNHLFDPNIR